MTHNQNILKTILFNQIHHLFIWSFLLWKLFRSFLWDTKYVYRLLKNWYPANEGRWRLFDVVWCWWASSCLGSALSGVTASANQRKVLWPRTNRRLPSVSHPPGLVWEEASISVLHSEKIGGIGAVRRAIPRFTWQGLPDLLC